MTPITFKQFTNLAAIATGAFDLEAANLAECPTVSLMTPLVKEYGPDLDVIRGVTIFPYEEGSHTFTARDKYYLDQEDTVIVIESGPTRFDLVLVFVMGCVDLTQYIDDED